MYNCSLFDIFASSQGLGEGAAVQGGDGEDDDGGGEDDDGGDDEGDDGDDDDDDGGGPVEEIYSRNTFGRINVCFAYFKRQFIPFIIVFEYMCGCFVVTHFWSKSIN